MSALLRLNCRRLIAILTVSVLTTTAHADESLQIGQDGSADHRLVLHGGAIRFGRPIPLETNIGGPLDGYCVAQEPLWLSLLDDHPGQRAFRLLPSARIVLVRLDFDPRLGIYDTVYFRPVMLHALDHRELDRDETGDIHALLLYAADPATPTGLMLCATFCLRDVSGQHADSAPFTLRFSTGP